MNENPRTTPIETRESARGTAVVPPKAPDLNRPQRMLGVVLWVALVIVVMWLRVGAR